MLFDTTFFIDFEDEAKTGRPAECRAFIEKHRHYPRHCCSVTVGEFAIGSTVKEAARLFRGFNVLPLGRNDAIFCGQLQRRLKFTLGENDLWIAGTALRHGFPLVTRDKVFPLVPNLRVISY